MKEMPIQNELEILSKSSNNKVAEILENELSYFDIPEELRSEAKKAVEIGELIFLFNEAENDDLQMDNEIPVKIYRSKEWRSDNPKDGKYSHFVRYYADIQEVSKEYLPEELRHKFRDKWVEMKLKYPLLAMSVEDKNKLFKKIYDKNASEGELEIYKSWGEQIDKATDEFNDYKKASILVSSKIEKKIVRLKKPLFIQKHTYEASEAFNMDEYGINDIRYISQEEREELKSRGYDSILFQQYGWVVLL